MTGTRRRTLMVASIAVAAAVLSSGVARGAPRVRAQVSGATSFYFAEGTVRSGFLEYLTIQNASPSTGAAVTLTYQASDDAGAAVPVPPTALTVGPSSRTTVNVTDDVTGKGVPLPLNVSVLVLSNQPIVVERPMYFSFSLPGPFLSSGGTTVVGSTQPSTVFYFAEGTVRENLLVVHGEAGEFVVVQGFVEFLTLQNPNATAVDVTLTFQASDDAGARVSVPTGTLTIPGSSRGTVNVNEYVKSRGVPLPVNLSVQVTSSQPIVAERPIYTNGEVAGVFVTDGTVAMGATSPSTTLHFAEGTVRPDPAIAGRDSFVEFLTIQNPSPTTAATVTVDFQASNDPGSPVSVPSAVLSVGTASRTTFNVNAYVRSAGVPLPVNISVRLTSTQPIVAERPMYFFVVDFPVLRFVHGATTAVGVASPSTAFSFAEGTVRSGVFRTEGEGAPVDIPTGFVEFLTIQNPSATTAAGVTMTFQASNDAGAPVSVPPSTITLAPSSRATVNVYEYVTTRGVPVPVNVSVRLTSTAPIVAERPIYFSLPFTITFLTGTRLAVLDGGTNAVGFAG